jgi:ABC-2 type transport system permease protein
MLKNMFNPTLYKREMKNSLKMLIIFAAVLTLYVGVMVSMYDPEAVSLFEDYYNLMPEVMSAIGMSGSATSAIGFLSQYLYGFILIAFPMIYSILCGNRLVAKYVDDGSMVSLLAAPVKRKAVAVTQAKVLITGVVLIVLYVTAVELICAHGKFPGELETGKLIALNASLLCLHLFIAGVCFLASCLFSETKYSIGFGAGIPALMLVLQMLSNSGGNAEKVKYVTFFTLFSPNGIISGERGAVAGAFILLAGAIALFGAAVAVFSKKDLHI